MLHKSARYRPPLAGDSDPDASVMAYLWRICVRSWPFALVRRVVDLPVSSADVRRIRLDDFPKLSTIPAAADIGGGWGSEHPAHYPHLNEYRSSPAGARQSDSSRSRRPLPQGRGLSVDHLHDLLVRVERTVEVVGIERPIWPDSEVAHELKVLDLLSILEVVGRHERAALDVDDARAIVDLDQSVWPPLDDRRVAPAPSRISEVCGLSLRGDLD
jgi:hypothetical protein